MRQDDRTTHATRPWLTSYGDVPPSLEYPQGTIYDVLAATIARLPDKAAFEFFGTTLTYRQFGEAIDDCAAGLSDLGLGTGDRMTIAMPTSPQAIIAFYAALKLGAVVSMVHPLSTPPEIALYLSKSRSRFALTLDAFYGNFAKASEQSPLDKLILARIGDFMPPLKRLGFWLTRGRKIPPVPADPRVVWWSQLMDKGGGKQVPAAKGDTNDLAVILYSGGTTGEPKGIMLSHRNFISEGMEVDAWGKVTEDDRVLAALPIFHGFGLSVLVNAPLMCGAYLILVPVFDAKTTARLIRTARPTIIAGVPTLYDSLAGDPSFVRADLSSLRMAFSGADGLPLETRQKFEDVVAKGGGSVRLMEGYGLTEAVSAVIGSPLGVLREGSIGVPLPDILVKICEPEGEAEVPTGEDGEICIAGPAVMIGYLDNPDATAKTIETHDDGLRWLRTGDIGQMDRDGFVYFTGRLKQMIKSSGMNVYPAQVEAVLRKHPAVLEACVIGVPDPAQVERVKAIVVPQPGYEPSDALEQQLIQHCQSQLIKWSCPREVSFRTELPRTRVGKIDLKTLKEQEEGSSP